MLKSGTKLLTNLLKVVSIITLINTISMYWFPIYIPLGSFSAVRFTLVALMEKQYSCILVSILIGALLFITTVAVRRQHIFLPSLSLLYLIYDCVMVLILFVDGIDNGYWKIYIIQIIVSIVLIVLLCIYCWNALQTKLRGTSRGDGSLVS